MSQVRVRMYRPGGIGDCFLLSFPKPDGMAHVLIDCGVLRGTDDGMQRMQEVVKDIAATTNSHVDVLVVTHEHWDHVSGFLQAADQFEALQIDTIWLAWTEDLQDELAKQLREARHKAIDALRLARQKLAALQLAAGGAEQEAADVPTAGAVVAGLDSLSQFWGDFGAAGAQSTAAAMALAQSRPGVQPICLKPGGGEPLALPGVEGVRVYVLGPPYSEQQIKRSDPSRQAPEVYEIGGGRYLGFAAAFEEVVDVVAARPFDRSYASQHEQAAAMAFFAHTYVEGPEWRRIDHDWLGTAEVLALKLDADTNNTSLALAFELVGSGRVLLFPGDAQVGSWLSWGDLQWTVKDRSGAVSTVKTADLLRRTVLYKVGHHGSHNATLRERGLELMTDPSLVAMITVDVQQAARQGTKGWEMPFPGLLKRLNEKTSGRILRTDLGAPEFMVGGAQPRCQVTDRYIDYFVDI
jgi:hypothetical protein